MWDAGCCLSDPTTIGTVCQESKSGPSANTTRSPPKTKRTCLHMLLRDSFHCIVVYGISFIHPFSHHAPIPRRAKGNLQSGNFVAGLFCPRLFEKHRRNKKTRTALKKHRTTLCCFEVKHLHVQRLPLKTIAFRKWKKLLMQSHFCQPCLENLICLHLGRSMETVPPTRRRVSIA